MRNPISRVGGMFRFVVDLLRPTRRISKEQPITPEEFRRMLEETLAADPTLARRVMWPLAGTVFPIVGGLPAVDTPGGIANNLAKFTDADTIDDSQVFDDGTNVGIGTTTPYAKLDVNKTIRALSNPVSPPTTGKGLEMYYNGTLDYGIVLSFDRTGVAYKPLLMDGSLLLFIIGATEKMRIDAGGNVGIGTTSPQSKLNVKGSASFAASGTVAVSGTPSNPNPTVTGTGTSFTSQVVVGDRISVTISGKTYTRTVTEVTSNTSLKVDAGYHVSASPLTMTVLPSIFRGDNASGTPIPQFTVTGDGSARFSGFLGLAGTRIHNDDDVGYVVCFAEVPFIDKNNEMRGYQSTMVYTRTTADANIGGEGWDVMPFVGAVSLESMNLPSGDRDIRGQMKPFQSELRFEAKASGAVDYNVVAPALNYVASLFAVDSSCTITRWAGYMVDSPCEVCGAANKVLNGYGVWVQDLDDSPTHTLQAANAAAIQIDGLSQYGRIRWGNEGNSDPSNYSSIYQVSESGQRRLEFYSTGYVRTAAGVGFQVGGASANAGLQCGSVRVNHTSTGAALVNINNDGLNQGNISTPGYINSSNSVRINGTTVINGSGGVIALAGLSVANAASPGAGAFQVGSSFSGSPQISMNTSNGNIGTLGLVNAIQGFMYNNVAGFTGTGSYTNFVSLCLA